MFPYSAYSNLSFAMGKEENVQLGGNLIQVSLLQLVDRN